MNFNERRGADRSPLEVEALYREERIGRNEIQRKILVLEKTLQENSGIEFLYKERAGEYLTWLERRYALLHPNSGKIKKGEAMFRDVKSLYEKYCRVNADVEEKIELVQEAFQQFCPNTTPFRNPKAGRIRYLARLEDLYEKISRRLLIDTDYDD